MGKRKHKHKKTNNVKSAKYQTKDYIFIIGGSAIFFFYVGSGDPIINYPSYLFFYVFLFCAAITGFFIKNEIKNNIRILRQKKDDVPVILTGMKLALISVVSAAGILGGLNTYNQFYAEKSYPEFVDCEIINVVAKFSKMKVFFEFNDRTHVLRYEDPIMFDLRKSPLVKDYFFRVKLRKGLLGSYVIEKASIKHK